MLDLIHAWKLKGQAMSSCMHACMYYYCQLHFQPVQATSASHLTAIMLLVAVLLVPEGNSASLGMEQRRLGIDPVHLQVSPCYMHALRHLHEVSCLVMYIHNRIKVHDL